MSFFLKQLFTKVAQRGILCLITVCLFGQNIAVAEAVFPSNKTVTTKQISEWIDQLDSNKRAQRRFARDALLKAGPAILPLLPAPELLKSNSIREAVRQIRIQLEQTKAKQDVKGTHINIVGQMTLHEVAFSLMQFTKNKIDLSRMPRKFLLKKETINFKNKTFLESIDKLESIFSIVAELELSNQQLVLRPLKANEKTTTQLAHYTGPFRVSIRSAKLRKLFGDNSQQLLRVTFQIVVEPRLRPLFMKLRHKEIVAKANQQTLKHYNPDANIELALGEGGKNLQFVVDYLVSKKQPVKKISLAGSVKILIAAGEEEIVFSDLSKANGVSRRRGGVTVRINKLSLVDKEKAKKELKFPSASIEVAVSYDTGGPAFESHRTWIFHNLAYLKNSAGKRINRNAQFGTSLQKDGAVAVEYGFDLLTEPVSKYKFVYVAPTLLINVPVKFSFTGVGVEAIH